VDRDDEIRKLLTPGQSNKFDVYLKLRREMAGGSGEDREYTGR